MVKLGLYGLLLGMVVYLSLPAPVMAGHVVHPYHHGHRRHHPPPKRHHGFRFGVAIGSDFRPHGHPHGHRWHRHGPYCPVVIEKHVYHYAPFRPIWHIRHYRYSTPKRQTILYLVIPVRTAEVYVDGYYLGQTRGFRHGRVRLPVTPGKHTVQLRLQDNTYTRQVHVKRGSRSVVEVRLQR